MKNEDIDKLVWVCAEKGKGHDLQKLVDLCGIAELLALEDDEKDFLRQLTEMNQKGRYPADKREMPLVKEYGEKSKFAGESMLGPATPNSGFFCLKVQECRKLKKSVWEKIMNVYNNV